MKAAVIRSHGGVEAIQFEERVIPHPKTTQVLIQVKACGLNHLDIWVRKGVPGHKFPLPIVPGSDIAGIVSAVGTNVTNVKVGDRVIVDPGVTCGGSCEFCKRGEENLCTSWGLLGESCDGGSQEYINVESRQVHKLSDKIAFEQAACIPIAYVTAWHMLVEKAKLQSGQTVLIHAAGSGVSVACIQIAKKLGAQVFVTSTSEDKLQRAKALKADRFINISKDSFREQIKLLTSKRGVDVVIDHVGEPTLVDSIKSLRRGGKLVSCGATAGSQLNLDWKIVFFKNLELMGSTYGTVKNFNDVLKAFQELRLHPLIDSTFPFKELREAHKKIENRNVFGKVVITF